MRSRHGFKTKADDILGKLKGGAAFDALAAAEKLKIETATDIKRGGTNGAITPRMTEAIFHTAKDAYGDSVGDQPTQWVVFRVTDIKTPSLDANSPTPRLSRRRCSNKWPTT